MKPNTDAEDARRSRRAFLKALGVGVFGSGLAAGVLVRAWRPASRVLATDETPDAGDVPDAGDAGNAAAGSYPAYLALHASGELKQRAEALWDRMRTCTICPRACGARRLDGARGFCQAPGDRLVLSGASAHFGEERPLVGRRGSGTIFFSHCNLRCVFCQNWEISHRGRGSGHSLDDLAGMMLRLQDRGCHNINVVTPTHYLPHILKALDRAAGRGLRIPIVYNTSGWERLDIVRQLDGIVDIYLPDIKFADGELAERLAGAPSYPEVTKAAVAEMHRQVGVARTPDDGVMRRGLMIRHLVMPNQTADSIRIMEWIAETLPLDTYINIMAQFSPHFQAFNHPDIARRVTREEYRKVVQRAQALNLTNLDTRTLWWR